MKKFLILFVCSLLLTSCAKNPTPVSSGSLVTPLKSDENDTLVYIGSIKGVMTKQGYYYLQTINTDSGSYTLLKFLDPHSMLEVPLCNKPNCTHNSESCNAYIREYNLMYTLLFTVDGNLYLSTLEESNQSILPSENNNSSENTGFKRVIYSMNPDGTNRTKIMELEPDTMPSGYFATGKNSIYCVSYTEKQVKTKGNNYTSVKENQKLVRIDLKKKSVETICDMIDKSIIGVYKNKILISYLHSDVDPTTIPYDDNQAFDNWNNNLDCTISLFDISTKQEEVLAKGKHSQFDSMVSNDKYICYFDKSNNTASMLDLDNKKTTALSLNAQKNISFLQIIDERLIYFTSQDNGMQEKRLYYDLHTGENKELSLQTESVDKGAINLCGEIGNDFLVIPKFDEEKEITWAGTVQYNIIKNNYAFIKKSDYWNSVGNYSFFEEG